MNNKTEQKKFANKYRVLRRQLYPTMKVNGLRARTIETFLCQDLPNAGADTYKLWFVFLMTMKDFVGLCDKIPLEWIPSAYQTQWKTFITQ